MTQGYRRWKAVLLSSTMMLAARLGAQVVELSGGSSSLYQSQGGTLIVHGNSYSAQVGAGTVGGQAYLGARLIKRTERATYILGSDNLPFDLPTDIFGGGHYLTAIGAGVHTKRGAANLYGFVGATSTSFNSPFFDGARAETPAAIVFASGQVAPGWTASTRLVLEKQITIIHSFAYDSGEGGKFAISGGVGSGELYGASSLSITKPRYDVQAAYIRQEGKFRRVNVDQPLSSEPDRENVIVTVRPTEFVTLSAGRQNYLSPVQDSQENIRSSVNQASANVQVAGVGISASLFRSTYGDGGNTAIAIAASRAIGEKVHAQVSYLASTPDSGVKTDDIITTVQETLSPRWSLTQTINTSGGQKTVGFGGSFLSNLALLSADYQTFYVPSRTDAPFQQALILNAQIHLGRLTFNGATYVAPDGHLLYTTEAEGTVSRQTAGGSGAPYEHHPLGGMVLRGRVMDSLGQPMMGAAIMVDQLPVYTDSQGYFYVRERRARVHPVTVLVSQFLEGGLYRVISAPAAMKSSAGEQAETVIIVERVLTARLGP